MLLALLPALALGQSTTITIRAGTVLDGRGGVARNTTIVIAGSRIVRLDPALTTATYDLTGLTVMPGGIDTHVHLTSHFDANGRAHNDPGGSEPLEEHPRRRWPDALRGRAARRVRRSEDTWTALRRACPCRRGGAAGRAGGGHIDRARRAARRGDARSDGGARHVLRAEPLPRLPELLRQQGAVSGDR